MLGLVPFDPLRTRDPRARGFARTLGDRAGVYLVERNISTYDELEREMILGRIDIAWLPPMVFARLDRENVAEAMVTRARDSQSYWSVLVSAKGSRVKTLDDLVGARVAWVDPLSAAGYLIPRMGLVGRGLDPRATFSREYFTGSHAESLRAVLERRADVAATFAHLGPDGEVAEGPWTEVGASFDDVHIVAKLGEVPPDVIAARVSVPRPVRDALATALLDMAEDPVQGAAVESVFGGRAFVRGGSASYEALRELIQRASRSGLAGASVPYLDTSDTTPPSRG